MRIAVWYNIPSGGAKRALYHQVAGLVERGHHVESWCTSQSLDGYLPLGKVVAREHVTPVREWRSPRVPHLIEAGRRSTAIEEHCRACAQEINAGRFDVFFSNSCVDTVVSPIGRYVQGPKALYLPEPRRWLYEAALRERFSGRKGLFPKLLRTLDDQSRREEERESAAAYDLIMVNSLYSRESLARAYGLDSRVCQLGVDTDLFKPVDGALRGSYVVGLGELDYRKGVDRAIRAVATIDERDRPELVWIGNRATPGYQAEMESLAQSVGVEFSPRLELVDDELVQVVRGASAMIYTSRLEPFGFAPLEANACGIPVVAIAEGGVRETVWDGVNGLTVGGDDPDALGQAISRLLKDPELARELGVRGREMVVEKWTWPAAVARLEELLLLAVRKHGEKGA